MGSAEMTAQIGGQTNPATDGAGPSPDRISAAEARRTASVDRVEAISRSLDAALRVTRPQWDGVSSVRTDLEACLPPLLEALGWSGDTRHLVEALPYVDPIDSIDAFRAVLGRLGFTTSFGSGKVADVDGPVVFLDRGTPRVHDGASANNDPTLPSRQVPICAVMRAKAAPVAAARRPSWISNRISRLRSPLYGALALTLAVNLFAVSTPLFSMLVYNTVIPAQAYDTLAFAVALIGAALLTEDYLRRLRTRLIANVATRLHAGIMSEGVAKILTLPLAMIESVSATAQMAQLKRFENILGVFHGPAAAALLDLPFILVFVASIAIIGGPLALVPLGLALTFAVIAAVLAPIARHSEALTADARRDAQELLRETVFGADGIRDSGAERVWLDRMAASLDSEATATARQDTAQQMSEHVAQFLVALAGAAMLFLGASMVMDGALSIGALIASMMLTWRVLSPIQTMFLSIGQLAAAREDARMVDALMRIDDEQRLGQAARYFRRFDGAIQVDSVGFRHPGARSLAVRNVSLDIRPGERIGLMGPAGSGKSTLLRLALGLSTPTVGSVSLDGLTFSQLDVAELRAAFAYAPAQPSFFYGTVAQNMRIARHDIEDFEIEELLEALELPLDPERFPDGLGTRLTAATRSALGPSALQTLNLARALLSDRPVLMLDDPMVQLDRAARSALIGQLDRRRAQAATLVVGNERQLLEGCDRVLVMSRGRCVAYGEAEAVLNRYGEIAL